MTPTPPLSVSPACPPMAPCPRIADCPCDGHGTLSSRVIAALPLCLALLLGASIASAANYDAPKQFNGHAWGTPLTQIRGLQLWHAYTAIASTGKVTDFHLTCQQTADSTCSQFSQAEQELQGEGSFALGEYYFPYDGNPWHDRGVELQTISYLFCANSEGDRLPKKLRDHLTLCGARVTFRSDSLRDLAQHTATQPEYQANYDRLLAALVADYGPPPGMEIHGKVTVITTEEEAQQAAPVDRRRPSNRYRWCPPLDEQHQLRTPCDASITLLYEPRTGEGSVVFATGPLYEYAYARYNTGDENNELYVLLSNREIDHPYASEPLRCTGTRICQHSRGDMSAAELRGFQP